MNLPPLAVDLRFARPDGTHRHLWLPVVVLWPILVLVGLLALLVAALVDAALYAVGHNGAGWTAVVIGTFSALAESRGLHVNVSGPRTHLHIQVK